MMNKAVYFSTMFLACRPDELGGETNFPYSYADTADSGMTSPQKPSCVNGIPVPDDGRTVAGNLDPTYPAALYAELVQAVVGASNVSDTVLVLLDLRESLKEEDLTIWRPPSGLSLCVSFKMYPEPVEKLVDLELVTPGFVFDLPEMLQALRPNVTYFVASDGRGNWVVEKRSDDAVGFMVATSYSSNDEPQTYRWALGEEASSPWHWSIPKKPGFQESNLVREEYQVVYLDSGVYYLEEALESWY